jgi:hypothetical protein
VRWAHWLLSESSLFLIRCDTFEAHVRWQALFIAKAETARETKIRPTFCFLKRTSTENSAQEYLNRQAQVKIIVT